MHLQSLSGKLGCSLERTEKLWLLKDTPKCEFPDSLSHDILVCARNCLLFCFCLAFLVAAIGTRSYIY